MFPGRLLIACALIMTAQFCVAQQGQDRGYIVYSARESNDVPQFEIKMYNTASDLPGLSRLNVELRFDNDDVQFIRTKDRRFRADYEVEVKLYDQDSTEVEFSRWEGSALAEEFKHTTSKSLKIFSRGMIEALPGKYKFSIGLTDKETRRTGYLFGRVSLRDFSQESFAVSDIWFVDSVAVKPGSEPSDGDARLFARMEIYNACDSVNVSYKILSDSAEVTENGNDRISSAGRITPYVLEIPERDYANHPHFISFYFNCQGDSVRARRAITQTFARAKRQFTDLTDAIKKLTLLAKDDVVEEMLEADKEKQAELFSAFWKKRDPTPETDENEYMIEYYARINRATQLIRGQGQEGWKTEMGRVYVMMGPPDDIQRYASSRDSFNPSFTGGGTLLWQYYDLRRRVIFEYRFGEYRIANYNEIFDLLSGEMVF